VQALLCVATAIAVCGCQATDVDDPPETSHGLKVQHALGLTKVPGRAKRPVALYPSELDDAIALGSAPVGAAGSIRRYLGERTRGIRTVGPVADPSLSGIADLDPDLILASKQSHKQLYKRLKKIAPTVAIDEAVNWKPNLRQDGEALGYSDYAEKLLSDYDQRAARVKSLVRRHGQPTLPAAVRGALRRPFIASILDDVGIRHPHPRSDPLGDARPSPYDAWTLGIGYIAATRILADLERFTRS
jgi:ABC-type Fe3+-hydroxamate transport system substrate-binding protein